MIRRQKDIVKEITAYILVSYVIDDETWLHDSVRLVISYFLYIPSELLDDGYKTECRLDMIFFTWCFVKLYCYVALFSTCNMLSVYNYISHMGIKMISWSWVVCEVTKTS